MPNDFQMIGDNPLVRALMEYGKKPQADFNMPGANPFDGAPQPVPMQNPAGSNPFVMDYYRMMQSPQGQQMSPQQRAEAERAFYQQLMTR